MNSGEGQVFAILGMVVILMLVCARRRWQPSRNAYGTAEWASEKLLRSAGMLGRGGLILGRTTRGKLIRLVSYCHVLLIGSTGSGKGVSIIIPNLLSYFSGSVVCFDTKGDLHDTSAKRRTGRIIRLAPFNGGTDAWNLLDSISPHSPLLVDSARALAEALVVRSGMENDPHWNDKAAQVICALLVLVLLRFEGEERSLNTIQELASDPELLAAAAEKLREIGGIPARLGNQLKALFDKESTTSLTKEGAGVLSTVARHLAFLDSDLVAKSLAHSTFDPTELLHPGISLFLQIPSEMLEAQKGLLRCWIASLIRILGTAGNERDGEVLFLLDEASCLQSLSALEETLVRGRSAGVRLLLAYQSDSQVKAAFKDKPTLLYDNCTTQIYLGATSIETAERLSKSLGDWTQCLESYGANESRSWSAGGEGSSGSQQRSQGSSLNYSVSARSLLKPEEILTLDDEYLIAFQRGLGAPILARRIKWYQDPLFNSVTRRRPPLLWWWGLLAAAGALLAWALFGR